MEWFVKVWIALSTSLTLYFLQNKIRNDWLVDKKLFDGVWCNIVQHTKFWLLLLVVEHVAEGLSVENSRILFVWHWANKDCIRVVAISNTYIFVAYIGTLWKFFGLINFLLSMSSIASQQKLIVVMSGLSPLELELTCTLMIFLLWLVLLWITCSSVGA